MGVINNQNKNEFRLEAILKRDSNTIKKFVTNYIGKGNTIVTDGWGGHVTLDHVNSGYSHETHNHGAGDFGFGLSSISSIESLWNALKNKIKKTYHIIPSRDFISFLRESEWKYINRNKSYKDKIKEFFNCYNFLQNVEDVIFEKTGFLSDKNINDDEASSYDDDSLDSDSD